MKHIKKFNEGIYTSYSKYKGPSHLTTSKVDPANKDELILAMVNLDKNIKYEIVDKNEDGYFEIYFENGDSIEVRNDTFPFWVYRDGKRVSIYKDANHALKSFNF